jgi:hypothetical protein
VLAARGFVGPHSDHHLPAADRRVALIGRAKVRQQTAGVTQTSITCPFTVIVAPCVMWKRIGRVNRVSFAARAGKAMSKPEMRKRRIMSVGVSRDGSRAVAATQSR